jgi:hypothetical protein
MRLTGILAVLALAGTAGAVSTADAAPVAIGSYDVAATPASGFGAWSHTYTGTITGTGRFVPDCFGGPCDLVDERGGSGTLNDGVFSTSIEDNQLFVVGADSVGAPLVPSITLHLASVALVRQVRFFGGDIATNFLPGLLNGASATIGGRTVSASTTPAGTVGPLGTQEDDVVDLTGTGLDAIPTDTVTLSGFTADALGGGQFSVTEITVDATPVTAAALCAMVRADVTGTARYKALPANRRADVDRLVEKACAAAADITAKGTTPAKRARLIADFRTAVDRLRDDRWVTPDQAAAVESLANGL